MASFLSPVHVITGEGTLLQVPEQVRAFGSKKVMIYADPGVVKAGIVRKLEDILNDTHIENVVYSEVVPEPPLEAGNKAVQALKDSGADFVIGLGGGSSIDIAKAAAVLANHEGNVEDYLNMSGTRSLTNKGLPKMLIPTTSGTGSEVTDISVFSLESTKDVITHPLLLADVALVDPELTYTLPEKITASTGVDALTHAVESYISIHASPITDTLALDAVKRIGGNIRTAVWHGENQEARKQMSLGSLLAGMSFYNAGVAGVHGLAYPLGGRFKIPHGEANALLLPYVFEEIWPACMQKMGDIAEALGANIEGMSEREAAIAGVKELTHIVHDTGIETSLKAYGVKENDIEQLALDGIKQKRLLGRSPRKLYLNMIRSIYQKAYEGRTSI
ncbi:iron-containing alcohol dehydrogenase [Salsuginibacillus kocurii]|uniref:iron-containing alcohol dehydrogenase n=1 Tax=Salsuginibacillus kocurii TaxID=427078 RepID=UPI000378F7D4|nr:iron-containing alcohol dehydrogenase [Salsuginibacillus kocurii]